VRERDEKSVAQNRKSLKAKDDESKRLHVSFDHGMLTFVLFTHKGTRKFIVGHRSFNYE
jgi:hypothetical protein